jgi:Protein of unknown function (DUF2796)
MGNTLIRGDVPEAYTFGMPFCSTQRAVRRKASPDPMSARSKAFRRIDRAASLVALLAVATASAAGPHVHGAATLSVASGAGEVHVLLEAPLEAVVGFEHAPRNEGQRGALEASRAALARPGLLAPNAEAGCRLSEPPQVPTPAQLFGGDRPEHGDVRVEYRFACAAPDRLRELDTRLFEVFPRLSRIDVVLATGSRQGRATLKRPAARVALVR